MSFRTWVEQHRRSLLFVAFALASAGLASSFSLPVGLFPVTSFPRIRVEINAGGTRNYEPDWEPVRYMPQEGSNVFYKNLAMPPSMFESFPPVEAPPEGERSAQEKTGLFV